MRMCMYACAKLGENRLGKVLDDPSPVVSCSSP